MSKENETFHMKFKEMIKNMTKTSESHDGLSIIIDELILDDIDTVPEIVSNHENNYNTISGRKEITCVELAIINSYLYECFTKKDKEFTVKQYGCVSSLGYVSYGDEFDNTENYWFMGQFKDDSRNYTFQTKSFINTRNELEMWLNIAIQSETNFNHTHYENVEKKIIELAFNNSEYKGKCIKVKLRDGSFRGIEIINVEESSNELILNPVQKTFIEHFITRVGRGGRARYLLNGEPGTGKTESIREIARRLIPNVTFIIPDFETSEDLTSIMEACEIFENGVIIMDDIDLYLGSRDNGSYTRLLGQFLSFFDGVKKRKISLLASTNDKGLVDKAAERPGRFNFTLDYSFLDDEQIIKVCNIHLDEKWRIQEVYDALMDTINGKKVNITGAFIANLADNIREMSEEEPTWGIENTVSLIKESYKGFYSSQVEREKKSMGFTA